MNREYLVIGERFENWTIIDYAPDRIDSNGKHHKRFLCKCDCGNTIEKDYSKLKAGAKMCKKCYLKIAQYNSIPFEHKLNKCDLRGECGILYASNTKNRFYFDKEDYDKIKDICWIESDEYLYGYDILSKCRITFHRYIMNAPCDKVVDHISRNTYDCRKSNLRICNQEDNAKNRSLYKNNTSGKAGVSYDKKDKRWVAYIYCNKKRFNLGRFINKADAINARLNGEQYYYGEYAPK